MPVSVLDKNKPYETIKSSLNEQLGRYTSKDLRRQILKRYKQITGDPRHSKVDLSKRFQYEIEKYTEGRSSSIYLKRNETTMTKFRKQNSLLKLKPIEPKNIMEKKTTYIELWANKLIHKSKNKRTINTENEYEEFLNIIDGKQNKLKVNKGSKYNNRNFRYKSIDFQRIPATANSCNN